MSNWYTIKEGCMLRGAYGEGDTPEKAIADYADKIAGELLVQDAYRDTRREIRCPNYLAKETKEVG